MRASLAAPAVITLSLISAPLQPAAPRALAAAVPPATAAASPGAVTLQRYDAYRVRPGDTLSGIAARLCGSAAAYPSLAAASGIADPDVIFPGELVTVRCSYPVTASRVTRSAARVHTNVISAHRISGYGSYLSFAELEQLWVAAGGPSWAAAHAAEIAECESGGHVYAHNPSGATGLWQILGQVVGGNLYAPYVNALNAVSKFRASGGNFSQWVCR